MFILQVNGQCYNDSLKAFTYNEKNLNPILDRNITTAEMDKLMKVVEDTTTPVGRDPIGGELMLFFLSKNNRINNLILKRKPS